MGEREWVRATSKRAFLVFQCRGLCQGYKCYIHNPPKHRKCLPVYVVVNTFRFIRKRTRVFGAFRISQGCVFTTWWEGKQEENVECRKSLSKNTRSKKRIVGRDGRLSDSFLRHKNVKLQKFLFTNTSEWLPLNSMLSGEMFLWSCVIALASFTFTLPLRLQLRLSFSTTQSHNTKAWSTMRNIRRKRFPEGKENSS